MNQSDLPEEPVYYRRVQCPRLRCRSTDCPVTRTAKPIRYHKCRKSGHCFKSVQAPLIPPDALANSSNTSRRSSGSA